MLERFKRIFTKKEQKPEIDFNRQETKEEHFDRLIETLEGDIVLRGENPRFKEQIKNQEAS